MIKEYRSPADTARDMEQRLLQRLQTKGLAIAISGATGLSESTISRLKTEHLSNFCLVLAHAGFKLVPLDDTTISTERLQAFALILSATLSSPDSIIKTLTENE